MNIDKEIKWLEIQIERTLQFIKQHEGEDKTAIEKFTLVHYIEIKSALEKLKRLKQMQYDSSLVVHKLNKMNPKLLKHIGRHPKVIPSVNAIGQPSKFEVKHNTEDCL